MVSKIENNENEDKIIFYTMVKRHIDNICAKNSLL